MSLLRLVEQEEGKNLTAIFYTLTSAVDPLFSLSPIPFPEDCKQGLMNAQKGSLLGTDKLAFGQSKFGSVFAWLPELVFLHPQNRSEISLPGPPSWHPVDEISGKGAK